MADELGAGGTDGDDLASCGLCGRSGELDEPGWIFLEVSRTGVESVERLFCSQEHAAAWLQRPLPESEPVTVFEMSKVGTVKWSLIWIGIAVLLLCALGAMLIGSWTAAQWILY